MAELAVSASSDESVTLNAPMTAGTYYYGACVGVVAGESDTTNNCSSSVAVTVVEPEPPVAANHSPVASAAVIPDQALPVGRNAATVDMAPYFTDLDGDTLTYTVVSSDAGVVTASVSGSTVTLTPVSAGATTVAVTAMDPGGATATRSIAVTVGQGSTHGGSDLVVESPGVSDSNPIANTEFTFSATVRNVGNGDAVSTTLRYYRSTDATVTTSDTEIGTDAVTALAAAGSSSESVTLTAPSTPGTYYYGACVDVVMGESSTTNNCSASVEVEVTEPPPPPPPSTPDLEVGPPSVNDNSPETGGTFTFSAMVRNVGDGDAAATTLRYYRSTDATITSSDTEVGTDAVRALSAGGTSAESIDLTAPSMAGTYYYGACVDAVADESDTTNNCSGSVAVTVEGPMPDLVVLAPDARDSVETGEAFWLLATVTNQGDGQSAATTVRYLRSTDATITSSDTEVGTDAVRALVRPQGYGATIRLTAPSTAGTYYYGACVDAVPGESDTTNNCSVSVQVEVTEPPPPPPPSTPDLEVGPPSVNDNSPETGGTFTFSAMVRNVGDGDAAATTLRYYRSTDATITTSDTSVGTDAVGALGAGATSNEDIALTLPSSVGTYYYGACVDAVPGESDTTNNCSGSVGVDVE